MLVGLGQAYELQYTKGDGRRIETIRFAPEWWWAWEGSADGGSILLVRVIGPSPGRAGGKAIGLHTTFHGAAPTAKLEVEAWERRRPLTTLGRVIAIAYDARGTSATKNDRPYRHHFGAMAHSDRPPFDPIHWPDLVLDADHNLCVQRRRGNTFRLEEWITG